MELAPWTRRAAAALRAELGAVALDAVDAVYPPRCWLCGAGTAGAEACVEHRLPEGPGGPRCGRCAARLAPAVPDGQRCPDCRARPPGWRELVCAGDYDDLRAWVLAVKHGRRRELVPLLAERLAAALAARPRGLPRGALVVPVPPHPLRRLARGVDPAGRLAAELAAAAGLELRRALRRARATPPQGTGAPSREANVRGAFRTRGEPPAGRDVWLVDDVLTSGATVRACARALRAAGARSVSVAVLARA